MFLLPGVYDSEKKKIKQETRASVTESCFDLQDIVLIYTSAFHPVPYIPAALLSLLQWTDWNQERTPELFVNSYVEKNIKLEDEMWTGFFFFDSCFFCYAQSRHILTQEKWEVLSICLEV